jgi:hypothetical protein
MPFGLGYRMLARSALGIVEELGFFPWTLMLMRWIAPVLERSEYDLNSLCLPLILVLMTMIVLRRIIVVT